MQTAETITQPQSDTRVARLVWRPVALTEVLARTDYVTLLTTVAWFVLIAVCIWWGMFAGDFPWNLWPFKLFGTQLVFGFYLPWSVCVLLVMWFGLEWAVIPAYLATLFGTLHAHMPLDLAVVNALHNPLAMAVYFLFYCSLPDGYALRSTRSWLWFATASLLAALVSSIGAFMSEYQTGTSSAALWANWLDWWPNALGQSLLIDAPLIWLCSPWVERFKARWFPRRAATALFTQKLLLVTSIFVLCLALFVLLDERWTSSRAGNILASATSAGLRAQIQAQFTLQSFVIWVLALVLAAVSLGGVIIAGRWIRRLRAQSDSETAAARTALAHTEARFRHFFQNNPAPMWVYEPRNGRFLEVNDAALYQYGYTREEFLQLTLFDIHPHAEAERLRKIQPADEPNRNWGGGEWLHRRKDDTTLHVDVQVSSMRLDGRVVHLALIYDVSPRYKALAVTEQRVRELRVLAVASLDIAAAANVAAVLRITAERARQLTGANIAMLRCAASAGQAAPDRHVSLAPSYEGWRDASCALDDAQLYRQLLAKSPILFTHSEIEHHPWWRERPAAGVPLLPLPGLLAVPLTAGATTTGILAVSGKPQSEFDAQDQALLTQLAQIASAGIQNLHLGAALREHMRVLELRVAERTAELDSSNQELDAFAYSVAHDLRAPLRAMHGFANAVLEDYAPALDANGRDYLARIIGAAHNMDTLIQDLLTYSRIGRTHLVLEAVPLEEVVAGALEALAGEVKSSGAGINVIVPPILVEAHRGTLEQVIMNLVGNAIKFVAAGVRPEIAIRAHAEGGRVHLAIADNGIGIAPEHYERIFKVFERLHGTETYPGTGVGLSIVKKGLARMHGDISVQSGPGGSVFTATLKEFARERPEQTHHSAGRG